jgi:menaquinone-dependent protoporphyrinogen oxidase
MSVLIAYASKHGATRQIAERIASRMTAEGLEAEAKPVKTSGDLGAYEAFVIGSSVYYGSWMKEAAEFVLRNQNILADRPVWLFSSGPISADTTDEKGQDLREIAEPKQIADFREAIHPRDHRVFFGNLDRSKLRLMDRIVTSMPAFPGSEGDFRDWEDIEAWAEHIARDLTQVPTI